VAGRRRHASMKRVRRFDRGGAGVGVVAASGVRLRSISRSPSARGVAVWSAAGTARAALADLAPELPDPFGLAFAGFRGSWVFGRSPVLVKCMIAAPPAGRIRSEARPGGIGRARRLDDYAVP